MAQYPDWLRARVEQQPDITLKELCIELSKQGVKTSKSAVSRFLLRMGFTFKKTVLASEQQRPDVAEARQLWREGQARLDPEKLIFADETGCATNMIRLRGRALRGERLRGRAPQEGLEERNRPRWFETAQHRGSKQQQEKAG